MRFLQEALPGCSAGDCPAHVQNIACVISTAFFHLCVPSGQCAPTHLGEKSLDLGLVNTSVAPRKPTCLPCVGHPIVLLEQMKSLKDIPLHSALPLMSVTINILLN